MTTPARKPLLALTLHRPWPNLIERKIKLVENRVWHPRPRLSPGEWFAIHAGKTWDDRCIPLAQQHGVSLDEFMQVPKSVITCVARYDGHTDDINDVNPSQRHWFFGPIGWILGDVVAFPPIPCEGKQGLWTVPGDVDAKVLEAFRAARVAR
jgi:hypothetical protein